MTDVEETEIKNNTFDLEQREIVEYPVSAINVGWHGSDEDWESRIDSVEITHNQISARKGVYQLGGAGTEVTISENNFDIDTDVVPEAIEGDETDPADVFIFRSGADYINATHNWWGEEVPDFGELIEGDVDYIPWLSEELTTQ